MAKKNRRRTTAQERERKRRRRNYYVRNEERYSNAREVISTLERESDRKQGGQRIFEPFSDGVLPQR